LRILEAFGSDVRRMIGFAWAQAAMNMYPTSAVARMCKSEVSPLDAAGDLDSTLLDVVTGLNNLDKNGQAGQIRSKIKKAVDPATYAILEARLLIVTDKESAERKQQSIKRVAADVYTMKSDFYTKEHVEYVVAKWGKVDVSIKQLVQVSLKGERQERKDRGEIMNYLHVMFDDAVDMVEWRMK